MRDVVAKLGSYIFLVFVLTLVLSGCFAALRYNDYADRHADAGLLKVTDGDTEKYSGFQLLQRCMDYDSTLRIFIDKKGIPDYIGLVGKNETHLVFVAEDRAFIFRRSNQPTSYLLRTTAVTDDMKRWFTEENESPHSE